MISVIVNAAIGFLILILQSTVLRGIAIGGVMPDLLLILTVCAAIVHGGRRGSLVGFIVGLMEDLLFFKVLGFYALIYMLIGYVSGYLTRNLSRSMILLPIGFCLVASLFAGLFQFVFLRFMSGDIRLGYYLRNLILPETIYTVLLGVVLYPLLILLNELTERLDETAAEKRRLTRRIGS